MWELGAGGYGEATVVRGDETYRAARPYPVEVTPSRVVEAE